MDQQRGKVDAEVNAIAKCGWRLAVYSRSLPALTPELAVNVVREAGYEGIQWRVSEIPAVYSDEQPSISRRNLCCVPPTAAGAKRARHLCEESGVELVSLNGYPAIGDLEAMRELLELADIAGAGQVRVFAGTLGDAQYQQVLDTNIRYFASAARYAEDYGVRIAIQMHQASLCCSASLTHRLVSNLDPRWIGAVYDPGGMAAEGFEDYRIGFALLGEYVCDVWLKNSTYCRPSRESRVVEPGIGGELKAVWTALDQGDADIPTFLSSLRASGYKGWLTTCDFSEQRDAVAMLNHDREYLARIAGSLV